MKHERADNGSSELFLFNRRAKRDAGGRIYVRAVLMAGVLAIPGWLWRPLESQTMPDAALPGSSAAGAAGGIVGPAAASEGSADAKTGPDAKSSQVGQPDFLSTWAGRNVVRIDFLGVPESRLNPLPEQLEQQAGTPLRPESVRASLRRLYATGLYDSIAAEGFLEGEGTGGGVVVVYRGAPRTFIGVVTVTGATGANMNALLVRTSRLSPGTRFTSAVLSQAEDGMRRSLAENGFHEPAFTHALTPHPENQLIDIAYRVVSGPQARIGEVTVNGQSGFTPEQFRHYSRLKPNHKIDRETTGNALNGLVNRYRKEDRLEAEVKLESQEYEPPKKTVDFHFTANRGPLVHVLVDGATLSQGRVKRLLPIYEEGSVDEDLLNEGNRRLQNYFQRLGYFDVKVRHAQKKATAELVEILFTVEKGAKHRVEHVTIQGAKYFDLPTLQERLGVHARDAFDRQGVYNQSLVTADVNSLQAIYQNNGFSHVKVTAEIQDPDGNPLSVSHSNQVPLNVIYHIEEGPQQRVHAVEILGTDKVQSAALVGMMNTAAGQPLSPESLAGDRETLLTYYLSRGFDQAQIELTQAEQTNDPSQVDVTFHVREGEQVFLRRVLITGLHYTRLSTIAHGMTLQEGEPLDETALLETQRNLYDLALFNEVNPVIQNPTGEEPRKTVLLQTTEARRWDMSYGLGFEVQTGTVNGSTPNNPNGNTGASPRVLLEVSRINLFGREQSASLRGTYGLLEQRINFVYQYPKFHGSRNFGISVSLGYNNSQDVTTYSASKLEGSFRLTEHFFGEHQPISKANTFIYQYIFRRVKVNASSVQVEPDEIPLISEPVQVGGPSFNWLRDTRDAPLDARRGTYTSFQEFLSNSKFGSEADFNQVDISNSSYYPVHKGRITLARNTRYGQERAYGPVSAELIPLPERLYGGGGNSHRGFGINSAGPRDPQTGFPIGGAGVFINSTELRLPAPTLPYVGNSLSFVPFHDMGNVFTNASDVWPSMLRFRQEDRDGCRNLNKTVTGPVTSTGHQGTCTFNYFSHALGLGLRYRTPVGPVRVDFSYNLNPPIYPVTYDSLRPNLIPYVGEGSHFNFFFSLGQSF
jgi:outer membrane protein insertion porin family